MTVEINEDNSDTATDDKGRMSVHLMTAEECARETLAIQRALQDLVEGFFSDMKSGKLEMPGPMGMMLKMLTR